MENPTTQDKLKRRIEQARVNGETAQKIVHHLDEWGDKHFDRRFVRTLEGRLGDGYRVSYYKYFGDSWHLTVSTTSQLTSAGIDLWLGSRPTTAICREQLAGYLEGVESIHVQAAMFELAYYDDIRETATRIQGEITNLVERYGRNDGRLTHDTRGEVKRILEGARL